MSESEIESTSSRSASTASEESSDEGDFASVPSVFLPYQFEPLAREGQDNQSSNSEADEDGLTRTSLKARYDKEIPLAQW